MRNVDDSFDRGTLDPAARRGVAMPSVKERTSVHNAVRALLDELAPEKAPPRGAEPKSDVQRYRSPRGCILQRDAVAVSVSWFASSSSDGSFGELHIIGWDGTVSRPGASQRAAAGARPCIEEVLRPVAAFADRWSWRGADGTDRDAESLVAHCRALLDRDVTSTALLARSA